MSDKAHDFLKSGLVCIYAQFLPRIRARGKELGYAIAIHGSMTRDLDLLAVPWVEDAASPEELVRAIAQEVGVFVLSDGSWSYSTYGYVCEAPTEQPHGRLSWNICWGGHPFIDLSVMPRIRPMKLTDLNPRWFDLENGGDIVGITFDCPHCRTVRLGVEFEFGIDIGNHHPGIVRSVPADGHTHWHRVGETFDTLTITPSIDASASGHWHGFITDGVAKNP